MSDWKKRAREARKRLGQAKHGEREVVLKSVAGDNDPNTVRRAIFALGYLDDLKRSNPSVWQSLQSASLSQVELLARWHSFDETGATKAAHEVGHGHYTVAELRKAMNAARVEVTEKSESLPYSERVKGEARAAIQEMLGGSISGPEVAFRESADDPPLDFRYTRMYGSKPTKFETVVAIIVGPYQDRKLYRKRRHDWLYHALGLAWFYDHVVVILPEANELESYRSWIDEAKRRAERIPTSSAERTRLPRVHVIHPKLRERQLTDEEAELLAPLAKP
jgi:hypothetical protein